MKDSIHKRLTDHIRKTVGRYELPYEPGSWEEFQRLQRRRRQQPVIWFRYALAACLLLGILGVPVWFYTNKSDGTQLAVRSPKSGLSGQRPLHPSVENRQRVGAVLPDRIAAGANRTEKPLVRSAKGTSTETKEKNAANRQDEYEQNRFENQNRGGVNNRLEIADRLPKNRFIQPETPFNETRQTRISADLPAESSTQTASFAFINPRSIRFLQHPLRPLSLPLSIWKNEPAVAKIEPAKTGPKPVWGVSLAPQSVYAAGSSPSVAVGGGLFSEIPLSRKFSLSTGLSMAQQKLGTKEAGLMVFSTVPQLVSTGIRLTSVDLPLNIRFRPGRLASKGFYAEAGLSSLAFLNEHYAYTYEQTRQETISVMGTNGQEVHVTQLVTTQQTTTQSAPAFQKIYWGRIINLSIGVERRLGTQFRLSAEPYVKYPVGPFTRENLMLGSGGVSLRLGFQSGR
ncbi:outer membrane beta-barrel protein [Larkinella rosea]|uniref:PorT family protein n=1 Tax=Larkinella rosea TaxID=2025312 RepID=A0A3P1BG89_9BACT|nr:outer membrane beta-barrel protein [Larkinella rosea]RRA99941.1 PorT family protein [Larkinella rosea]